MKTKISYLICSALFCLVSDLPARDAPHFERISREQGLSHSTVYSIAQDRQGFMWFSTEDGLNRHNGYDFEVFKHDSSVPRSLSISSQSHVCEDRSGMVWAGTWGGGLNRFDPRTGEFVRFRHDPEDPHSLSEDHVQFIFEDSDSVLWVGTFKRGLNRLDRETGRFARYLHDPENPRSLSNNRIWSIVEARKGMLLIGTDDGLNLLDVRTGVFTHFRHDPDDPRSLSHSTIRAIAKDRRKAKIPLLKGGGGDVPSNGGEVLFGTDTPLRPPRGGISHAEAHKPETPPLKGGGGDVRFWVGTQKGLNRFDLESGTSERFFHDPNDPDSLSENTVNAIFRDRAGKIWVGTNGGGLNRFERESGTFVRYRHDPADPDSLGEDDVRSLFEDRGGNLWVGTRGGGLSRLDLKPKKFTFQTHEPGNPDSLSDSHVMAVWEGGDGNLWIGTKSGGLNRLNRKTGEVTHYRHDPENPQTLRHDRVLAIREDRSGMLWVGHKKGLARLDPRTGQFRNYANDPGNSNSLSGERVISIYEDRAGMLWIGTKNGGLNRLDPRRETFAHHLPDTGNPKAISDKRVIAILEDHLGALWLGTSDGLNRLDRGTGEFVHYKPDPENPKSLSNQHVLCVYEDSAGVLWVGTREGLNRLDRKTGEFVRFKEKDGLPNHAINGILEDGRGRFWLSTNRGMSRFDPRKKTFRNYDAGDGLRCDEFSPGAYLRNEKGEMFFGGITGLVSFHPEQVRDNPHIPPVVLTGFRKFGKVVSPGGPVSSAKRIELSYKDAFFSLEFAALDYTFPQKNRYAYKLEGFDRDWIRIHPGNRRFASYTNLDGGKYLFRVRGSNNDGVWNQEGISVSIEITSPPWKRWWAYMLYAVFSGGLVFGLVRYNTLKKVEESNRRLKLEIEERKRVETELKGARDHLRNVLDEAESANRKVMESIRYAERIQSSLLPNPDNVKTYLPRSFFIWKPRDVVSGDIFFADCCGCGAGFVIAVVDCTGHGVPGAFMTMIASSALRRIIRDERCHDPAKILKRLNLIVKTTLHQDTGYALSDDGLDAAVCFVSGGLSPDSGRGEEENAICSLFTGDCHLVFAGAKLPLFCVRDKEVRVIKGDRQSIGYKRSNLDFEYTDHGVSVEKGMAFYMASDGFWDQLGGERKRCFSKKRFSRLLADNSGKPFQEQRDEFLRSFEAYRGDNEIQDDVTVIGFGF